jgi:MFS family permease
VQEKPLVAKHSLLSFVQLSNRNVWLLALGRSLCQIGSGLLNFYIPLVFVNQVGLSATAVGFSIGLSSIAEVVGHFMGGALADAPRFGRKPTLILSIVLGATVSFILAVTHSLLVLLFACVLLGLGVGAYWTAADAAVMDVTTPEERNQAFAIATMADNVGTGIGVLGGGILLLQVNQKPQWLFVGCGLIFLVFLLVQSILPETRKADVVIENTAAQGILLALKDKALIILFLANTLFTTYIALVTSTIPLYFTNFVSFGMATETSIDDVANLFTWCYIGVGTVLQLPIAHFFSGIRRVRVLMLSMVLWAAGFLLIWVTGTVSTAQMGWGIAALCVMSVAATMHRPFAAAIVAELAPESLRGAYVGVNSQSWAVGYFIGPVLGGWAMDQPQSIADNAWLIAASSTILGLLILYVLDRICFQNALLLTTEISELTEISEPPLPESVS